MFIKQLFVNFILFFSTLFGIVFNRRNLLITLMSIELLLLSLNLNFAICSMYLDDCYGQLFILFVLTVAASESAIGLALIITFFKVRGSILINDQYVLRF